MGEPRLSDIAPDLIVKHPANRSNSLKNQRQKSADMHCDLSYIPLPTSEEQADDLSGDEVFISEDSARLVKCDMCQNLRMWKRATVLFTSEGLVGIFY